MSRYRRRSGYSYGHERARQHIEEFRHLSRQLGGSVEDVRQYFFSLPATDLNIVLDLYEHHHGTSARQYAQNTIDRWRTGATHMGGQTASRLFNLLPPVMPPAAKYRLVTNLWNHVGPSSKKGVRMGLDA